MKSGKPVEFRVLWEDWDVYKLESGINLKVKIPLSKISDTGIKNEKGETKFEFDGSPQLRVEGEIELHEPSPDQTVDVTKDLVDKVKFEVFSEGVQVYYIPKIKQLLILKYRPTEIWSTNKFDSDGFPLFNVEAKISVSFVKIPS